jgi:hypothetical protein
MVVAVALVSVAVVMVLVALLAQWQCGWSYLSMALLLLLPPLLFPLLLRLHLQGLRRRRRGASLE